MRSADPETRSDRRPRADIDTDMQLQLYLCVAASRQAADDVSDRFGPVGSKEAVALFAPA